MVAHQTGDSQPTPTLLAAALEYAARGWRVFPLQPNSKVPFAGTHGFHDAVTEPETIAAWWRRWPRANIGIATGEGLAVMDEDTYKGADAAIWTLPVTLTAQTARGGLHWYYAYDGALPSVAEGKLARGICIKATGGYVVAPPSTFAGNPYTWADPYQPVARLPERIARLIRGEGAHAAGPPHAPAATADGAASGEYWVDRAVARAREQGRNNAGLWLAQQLLWNDCRDPDGAMCYYARLVEDWEHPPYTEREAVATLAQARTHAKRDPARSPSAAAAAITPLRRDGAHPQTRGANALADGDDGDGDEPPAEQAPPEPEPIHREYHLTEVGNSERLVALYGTDIRYCKAFGWVVWTGTRWRTSPRKESGSKPDAGDGATPSDDEDDERYDAELAVREMAKATIIALHDEVGALARTAGRCEDEDEREALQQSAKRLQAWAFRSETDRMFAAMLSLARSMKQVSPTRFDRDKWQFNCANGTLDLRTGDLLPHRREDYLTHQSPVAYDPRARAPTFMRFLAEVTGGSDLLATYLQRLFGYALTGSVDEQGWYLLLGEGDNGKSTLMEMIRYVMGDYAGSLEPESITVGARQRDAGAASPDIADLAGKRLVTVTETEPGAQLASSRIKRLTGGDQLTGRQLHRDLFSFHPEFKLFVYTNRRPKVDDMSWAFWRRVQQIPFTMDLKHHPDRKDKKLPRKLRAEGPGVLIWLVNGCLAWQRQGLDPPPEVAEATRRYREEQDVIAQFLTERCEHGEGRSVTLGALYAAYQNWCEQGHERPFSKRRFDQAIGEHGFDQARTMTARLWIGLSLSAGGERI